MLITTLCLDILYACEFCTLSMAAVPKLRGKSMSNLGLRGHNIRIKSNSVIFKFSNIIYCIFCYAFILIVQYYLDRVYRLRTTRVKVYKFIVPTTYYSLPNTYVRKSYATKLFTKLQQIIDRSFFTSCGFKPGIPGFRGSVDFFLPFR